MTLGEVKVETLRLIGANLSDDIRAENIEELFNDEKYKLYLVNMVGSINRALSLLRRRGAIEKPEEGDGRIGHETSGALDMMELGVADELSEILPFYIQSELLRNEDPEAAAMALSSFARAFAEIVSQKGARQERVLDVMGGFK